MVSVVGFIPARLQSNRLPRKPLVDICGVPMIVHVWRRCLLANSLEDLYVVTDSDEIHDVIVKQGGKVIMTRSDHETGTDRIAEAVSKIECDIAVNIQGDEALVDPLSIDRVVQEMLEDSSVSVAFLVCPFVKKNSPSDIKAVLSENNNVLYMSRGDIPSDVRSPVPTMLKVYHIVPFRKSFLLKYASWEKGKLERIEYNEYLRILEKGYSIRAVRVDSDAISVDTEEDLDFVRNVIKDDKYFRQYQCLSWKENL